MDAGVSEINVLGLISSPNSIYIYIAAKLKEKHTEDGGEPTWA